MSLRFKLILAFITFSLTTVTIFGVVAYTSARDYAQHDALTHIHKDSRHLIGSLPTSSLNIEQLQKTISRYTDHDQFYMLVDRHSGKIANKKQTGLPVFVQTQILNTVATPEAASEGVISINGVDYLWGIDSIPGTPFELINIYHPNQSTIRKFLSHVSAPLGAILFIGIWLALWASASLAKLFRHIAEQNTQLEYQAKHDPLTQLPNRIAIGEIIEHAVQSAKLAGEKLIFCLIDLDALKEVNDTLGHDSGNILLNEVTRRLQGTLRSSDQIGRFGGNKFATIHRHIEFTGAETISNRLLESFEPIFEINGHNLYVRATLGMAIYPDHATGSQLLIQKAETALHKARKMALDFTLYDVSLDNNSTQRLRLTHDLRNAIHNEDLELYYQPKLDVRRGTVTSVEALARWIHPQYGFVPPDTFIDIAEHTGLIHPLTDWVLRTAIEQCSRWRDTGQHLGVSVNLSAHNLHGKILASQIANLIEYWNILPEQLCLEITETAMMTDPEHAKELLNTLDRLGVRISIDDFGTGYSSLAYLKQLPVDELKIDKSFVLNMTHDENDASIVRATVGLAHDLGLEVVAEGVEDQAAQNELSRLGCEYIQGFHIGKPVPPKDLTPILLSIQACNNAPQQISNTLVHIKPRRI